MVKKRFYLRSALIEIPNRRLTPQCHWTEIEVIMKESFQKENKKTGHPDLYPSPGARW